MKVLKSFKNAYYWTKAVSSAASGDAELALATLAKLDYSYLGVLSDQVSLLKSNLFFQLNLPDEAMSAANTAMIEINKSTKISYANKQYKLAYAMWKHTKACELKNIQPQFDISEVISVPLSGVSKSVKQDFPLRIHPQWDEEGL